MKYRFPLALLFGASSQGVAQQPIAPDPSSVAVPDLAVPQSDLADERKYFLFYKPGVSYAQAYSELSFCARYIPHGAMRDTSSFVPWVTTDALRPQVYNNQYGLVGDIMLAIIAGPLERSLRQMKMMRCMLPRGYVRYRTSEALWKKLNGDDMASGFAVQAKIASGPVPPTPRMLP